MKKIITLSIFLLAAAAAFADGTIDINSPTNDPANGWTWSSPTLTITEDGTYTITGGSATTNRIVVLSGKTANITLSGVDIDVSGESDVCAFDMTGSTVNLMLDGINTLKSGSNKAGLQAPDGATLVIDGTGSLTAISGTRAAGIGGGNSEVGGTITINGGTVTANGSEWGPGIGGGLYRDGGTITITGGTVTAHGGGGAAGIGGGSNGGTGGKITITGGTVAASGGNWGAGIGGGYQGGSGTIIITTGNVAATPGGSGPDAIGHGGSSSDSGNQIILTGASASMIGNVTLPQSVTIPAGKTLTIPSGKTLTVPADVILVNDGTITNNGTIDNCAGTLINIGTVNGSPGTSGITCGIRIPTPDAGNTVYVKKGGNGNGSSWANAYPELAVALVEAQTNTDIHAIWVAGGTYKPLYIAGDVPSTDPRDKAFVLVEGVKIYGGFAAPLPTEGGAVPAFGTTGRNGTTILSGDIDNTPADISGNAYHVVIGAGVNNTAVLDGITVTGGNANSSIMGITVNGINTYRNGGGIVNSYSSPTFTNVTVSGNSANYGGGIDNYYSSPTLTNVTVSGNTANNNGGGILNEYSPLTLTNVTVSGNSATNGGGIYSNGSIVTLNNTIVWGNSSGVYGSATYNYSLVQGVAVSGTNLDGSIDPLFASPLAPGLNTGGDYSLQVSSPAIGAGNNPDYTGGLPALATATDLAGNPRLFGCKHRHGGV